MPKPFDATLKELVAAYPQDWAAHLGLPAATPVEVIDADLSAVTAGADRVLRILEPSPWLLHLEFQASRDKGLPRRVLKYNVLLQDRHKQPAESVILLLRREAEDARLTGRLQRVSPRGRGKLEFEYEVIRLWQQPVEPLLSGGLGTLPLAPLAQVRRPALPGIIRRMEKRVEQEASPEAAATLWTSTYLLMGLRYPPELAAELLRGIQVMKESSTYQAILQEGQTEGRVEEARKVLLLLGDQRFGPPEASMRATIEAATDLAWLERWTARLLQATSWEELLAVERHENG
jgi:predicted transposase YdaD